MGREASCTAHFDGKTARGKAHLESTFVSFSGGARFKVPFTEMSAVSTRGGALHFKGPSGNVALELGEAEATKWAHAILHPKSVLQKLGVKSGQRICVFGLADQPFSADLAGALGKQPANALRGAFDIIFLELARESQLERIVRARAHLVPNGALWVVHAKGKASPLPERLVLHAIQEAGLVDTKVVAFSASHSATKAVIPVRARALTVPQTASLRGSAARRQGSPDVRPSGA